MIIRSQTGTGKSMAIVTGILQQLREYCTEEELKGTQYYEKKENDEEGKDGKDRKEEKEVEKRSPMKVLFLVPTRELGWQVSLILFLAFFLLFFSLSFFFLLNNLFFPFLSSFSFLFFAFLPSFLPSLSHLSLFLFSSFIVKK